MNFLAIGFCSEHEGFCGSRIISENNAQKVCDFLKKEFGIYFDQILMVRNGKEFPEVAYSWNAEKDYTEGD